MTIRSVLRMQNPKLVMNPLPGSLPRSVATLGTVDELPVKFRSRVECEHPELLRPQWQKFDQPLPPQLAQLLLCKVPICGSCAPSMGGTRVPRITHVRCYI